MLKYFKETIMYPKQLSGEILPFGVLWEYVSSTFLNGVINQCKVIFAGLPIQVENGEEFETQTVVIQENFKKKWKKVTLDNLDEAIQLTHELKMFHTSLDFFSNDLILVGLNKHTGVPPDEPEYTFFWFNRDTSNCSIGRFRSSDSKEEIEKNVKRWVNSDEDLNYVEIGTEFISGWVSF
jgi:bacillopeptidase F (M6 metalloprotease family)